MRSTFFRATKQAIKNLLKKPDTVMFPAEHVPIPEGIRGAPKLTPENCTLCYRCVRICPTTALSIEKIDKRKGNFSIDLGRCCYCGECEAICPFDAIHITDEWLTASLDRNSIKRTSLVVKKAKEAK